jgi:hypothetical protein
MLTECYIILLQWIMDNYWCACTGPVFQSAENIYIIGCITPVFVMSVKGTQTNAAHYLFGIALVIFTCINI